MQTEPIRIEVPQVIARRYRQATPEQRALVTAAVTRAMMTPEEANDELSRLLDNIGNEARAKGLNAETLEELLRDES